MRYALIVLMLFTAGVAEAGTPESEAQSQFEKGRVSYELRHWDEAIKAYKEAYRLDPKPTFLFRVADAYERKGNCERARAYYKVYARTAGEARSEELHACADDSYAPIGVEATGEGRSRAYRNAGLGAAVVGVLGIWGGVAASMNAREDTLTIKMLTTAGYPPDSPGIVRATEDRVQARKAAVIGFAVGGTALAAAVGLLLWDRHEEHRARELSVAPLPGGATFEATIHF